MYHDPLHTYRRFKSSPRPRFVSAPPNLPEFHTPHTTHHTSASSLFTFRLLLVLAVLAATAIVLWIMGGVTSLFLAVFGLPYFVHIEGQEPTHGSMHTSRTDAHTEYSSRSDKPKITFLISEEERERWMEREKQRFYDDVYKVLPWTNHIGSLSQSYRPYNYTTHEYPAHVTDTHFAHLSLERGAMVAYTPSEEHGIQDRQVRIKPGKYLEQFCSDVFNSETIARFVEQVKSYAAPLQIARTAEEIEQVYTHGPNSCMSHSLGDYRSFCHPVRVYGDSDLAVAYMGTLDQVSARCLIWPEKKLYCRIYGDTTLRIILEREGYSQKSSRHLDYGAFDGARIHAIYDKSRSTYVMPYVDCANSADLDGKYFVLRSDTDGEYTVRDADHVDGLIASSEPPNYCSRCETRIDEDERLCDSCNDDLLGCCNRCGEDIFDDCYEFNEDHYCSSCIDRVSSVCEDCDERIERHTSYCDDCRSNHYETCERCDEEYCTDDDDRCPNCEEEETEEENTYAPVPVPTPFTIVKTDSGTSRLVETIDRIGPFAVHVSIHDRTRYALTHLNTGLVVTYRATPEEVISIGKRLRNSAIDWSFTDRHSIPSGVSTLALSIIHGQEV